MPKNKIPGGAGNVWLAQEGGRESNSSPQVIAQTLAWLKKKRALLTLLHQGYESVGSVLVGHDEKGLEIDKPVDWPNRETRIRVLFKDRDKLWNYFTVDVDSATRESLYTQLPTTLFRLQRRAHYRVEAPRGSSVSFLHQGTAYSKIGVYDISAGGMQIRSKTKLAVPSGDTITNISISLPGGGQLLSQPDPSLTIHVRQGRIARVCEEERLLCYGIDFRYSQNEEEVLLRYVRQRELELLRKRMEK